MSRALGVGTVTVLDAIERRACYGLDIAQRTGLLPGTVYTTLRRLERRGLVEGDWEDPDVAAEGRRPRRRYYTLTPDGRVALQSARERLEALGFRSGPGLAVAGDAE